MGDGEGLIVFQKKNNLHHIMMWMRGPTKLKSGSLPLRKKGSPDALIPDGYFMLSSLLLLFFFFDGTTLAFGSER